MASTGVTSVIEISSDSENESTLPTQPTLPTQLQPTTTAANHEDSGIDNSDDIDTSEDVQRSNFNCESDSDEWVDFPPRKKKERKLGSNIKLEAREANTIACSCTCERCKVSKI